MTCLGSDENGRLACVKVRALSSPQLGLEYLSNAGRPGNWLGRVTDNGMPSGSLVVQTADDPAPGFYVSPTALEDRSRKGSDPRRYVNSEAVNYIRARRSTSTRRGMS